MGNEEVDHVEIPAVKKSLLQRYDIPVEHLSYEYVSHCTNGKELERIVLILRSGDEGCYPDLTKHAEKHLAIVKPESTILRVTEPVIKRNMLAPEKRTKLENDINEWMGEMKLREKDLEEGRTMQIDESIQQPAIREITFHESQKNKQSSENEKKHKRIGACDYSGWDKYDADTELNRIDLRYQQKQAEVKRAQKKLRDKEEKMRNTSKEDIMNKLTLTGTELSVMSEKEREKGNEAFRARDYEEALQFYNSSIAIDATINAYNNRAITYIKLRRYHDAVNDCNKVLSTDYTNVKALLRRGLALNHLEQRVQALTDYEAVLKLEPSNKTAVTAVNKLRGPCDSKKIRMKIEDERATNENALPEASSSQKPGDKLPSRTESNTKSEKSKSFNNTINLLNIKTVSKSHSSFVNQIPARSTSQIGSQVCFCDNAPSSSQYLSPKPHFRDVYCAKGFQSTSRFPKSQTIFTDANASFVKPTGVIIEEIPNESCEKSTTKLNSQRNNNKPKKRQDKILTNFATGDNDTITKKSSVATEELSREKYNLSDQVQNDKKSNKMCSETFKKPTNLPKPQSTVSGMENSFEEVIIEEEISSSRNTLRDNNSIMKNFESDGNEEIINKNGAVVEEVAIEKYSSKIELKNDRSVNNDCSKSTEKSAIATKHIETGIKISSDKSSVLSIEEIPNEPMADLEEMTSSDKTENNELRESCEDFAIDYKKEIIEKSEIITDTHSKADYSYKIKPSPEQKFDPIESPYQFLRLWHSMRNDHDLVLRANLLKALLPENMDTGNKLDGHMLSIILRCFEQHFCAPEDSKLLVRFLQNLGKVKRFSIIRMFLNEKDKKGRLSKNSSFEIF